jgi:hypothetical protein
MVIGSDGAMGFNYPTLGVRSFMFRALSGRPIAVEIADVNGIHSVFVRPNVSGTNLISSNYLSGGVYLPLSLSGRETAGDFVLATNGNVGIGNTSPGAKLDVRYDDGVSSGEHNVLASFSRNGSGPLVIGYRADGTNVTSALIRIGDGLPLTFGTTSANQAMIITNAGNVGIGTTTPGSKLTVQGSTAGATVLDIQGTSGQLFSITDDLTGTLFAVSDISGIPILSVDASGVVNVDGTLTINDEDIYDIDPYSVGSTLLCARYDFQNAYASFGTVSGNALFPANVGYSPVVQLDQAISLSGTWRARGYETTGDGTATLYQRIY